MTFAPVIGSSADALAYDDIILFVEEVEESEHNIDRQFNMLQLQGVLDRCKGVILGEFTDCGTEYGISVEEMLAPYLKQYNIPVLCGFPGGHDDVNLPLVMGAPVTIDVRADGATFSFGIEGTQKEVHTADIQPVKTSLARRLKLSGKIE